MEKQYFASGELIETNTLVWTSGVIARQAPGLPTESIGRGRRIIVDEFNKVKEMTNIYAIGDIFYQASDAAWPNGHPQLAQVAIQQGVALADNLIRQKDGKALKPFKYKNKRYDGYYCEV